MEKLINSPYGWLFQRIGCQIWDFVQCEDAVVIVDLLQVFSAVVRLVVLSGTAVKDEIPAPGAEKAPAGVIRKHRGIAGNAGIFSHCDDFMGGWHLRGVIKIHIL